MKVRGAAVAIVTPADRRSRKGNRVTAVRIAAALRRLGARPFLCTTWPRAPGDGPARPADLLIAIHARRSAPAIAAFHAEQPRAKVVLVLGGTEVYPRFDGGAETLASLTAADAIVGLQPLARDALPERFRVKVYTIVQSASPLPHEPPPRLQGQFQACVVAHLRPIKQPTMAADALALLPELANLRVVLAGAALDDACAAAARAAAAKDRRFRWVGAMPRGTARRLIARSHLLLVTSLGEGGASVVSEAIAVGTPVLATAVPGNIGLLGADWPGLFAPDRPDQLAELMRRAVADPAFLADLRARTLALQPQFTFAREVAAWADLLMRVNAASD